MKAKFLLAGIATVATFTAAIPAQAEVNGQIKAMIDVAMANGNEADVATIVKIAKQTNPDQANDIDNMHTAWLSDRAAKKQAALQQASLLDNWKGQGEAGGYLTTGNTKNSGIALGLNLNREGLNWRHAVFATADFQKTDGVKSRERYLVGGKVDYKFSKRAYAYGLGQWERDPFLGYSSRLSASGGVGYRVIDEPDMTLGLEAGPAWRRISYVNSVDESKLAGRAALDFAWQINPGLRFTENASTYIESGNVSTLSMTALDAKVSGALTARLSYGMQHESDPLPGRKKLDTTTRATLVYGF